MTPLTSRDGFGGESPVTPPVTWALYVALGLTSGSIIALQVIFTRVFSITIWHHFTYLVVGVALLGGGAAGTYLTMKAWTPDVLAVRLRGMALALSLSVLATLAIVTVSRIDPLRRAEFVPSIVGLAACFGGLFATFFLGGLVVSGIFTVWHRRAHGLYFADLTGAGVGAAGVLALVQLVGGPGALVFVAILAAVAGWLVGDSRARPSRAVTAAVVLAETAGLAFVVAVQPIQLPVPASKALGWAQRQFGFAPELTRWNPVGRVDVLPEVHIKEPMIVGGISEKYRRTPEFQQLPAFSLRMVTIDGTSMTGVYRFDGSPRDLERFAFLEHAVVAAPFRLGLTGPKTLLIGVGGGLDLLLSRYHQASDVTAIELNPDIAGLLRETFADYGGRLDRAPGTRLIVAEGRSFLSRTPDRYDIIQGIGLDNIAALSGGAYVMSESYLYTVDSVRAALERLTPRGVFSWTRNLDAPPREMLRLVALAAEALRGLGVESPAAHLALVGNNDNTQGTLLVSRQPFADEALQSLRQWAGTNGFPIWLDPLVPHASVYAEYLRSADPRRFERDYPFNIFPVTDDNPFFYNYFKWTRVAWVPDGTGGPGGALQRFPMGNLVLGVMVACSTVAALATIVLPLRRSRRTRGVSPPWGALVYFSALGMGYIIVQIVLIQRFTLFIGDPSRAIATTIFSMLVFSAFGSILAQRLLVSARRATVAVALVAVAIAGYAAALPATLAALHGWPDSWRLVASVAIIAPLAMLMGMPFPTGLRQAGRISAHLVPWAWGMNGVFSVLGSTLVILMAMASSFTLAFLVGMGCYVIATGTARSLWRGSTR